MSLLCWPVGIDDPTNLTNLLDLKVPPGTIQANTVNILGDFRNTGFVFAENINIASTVENLINERRLANPGTVEFEAGGGNWVFETGQRAQPGGFMSATNWNINAQHIQSIGGTFEFKGMTDAQTAQLTSFLRAQLQSLYGENFSESDIRDAINQDFHANKKPNQLRMILAVVVAIIIVIVTQGTGAELAGSLLSTVFTGATATAISAAYTALLVGISTQLITTGRLDFRALFQNIVIAAITAGLVQGLTNFAGSEGFLSPSTAAGVPLSGVVNGNFVAAGNLSNGIIQAGIRATVAGGISAATGQGNFGQAFTGSVVGSLAAAGANWIGDQFPRVDQFNAQGVLTQAANPIGNILAHAVLGCASAAAQRGDCTSGALGGAVGELVAPAISSLAQTTFNLTPNTPAFNATVQSVSSLTAGLVTTALGHNGVVATNTASNAVANNFLTHTQVNALADRLQACGANQACRDQAMSDARVQSQYNDTRLALCKAFGNCDTVRQELYAGNQAINDLLGNGRNGLSNDEIGRIAQLQDNARLIIRSGVIDRVCVDQACRDRAQFVLGVGRGLAMLTPAGAVSAVGLGSYSLANALIDSGNADPVFRAIEAIPGIPGHLISGLNSNDPQVRGEALVNALALGGGVGLLARSVVLSRLPPVQAQLLIDRDIIATGADRFVADGNRVFMGVDLNNGLPAPSAGWDYFPDFVKGARTDLEAYAHINGYQSEVRLANEIAGSGQSVLKWGDRVGAHGSDVISVNPASGEVTLWDSKFRSGGVTIPESATFSDPIRRSAAILEAREAIVNSNLSANMRATALRNLNEGTFNMNTVGAGNVRNSVQIRWCSGKPC